MSQFQRLVIRALLILIKNLHGTAFPKDATFEQKQEIMNADWASRWPAIQQFEQDAEAALAEEEP